MSCHWMAVWIVVSLHSGFVPDQVDAFTIVNCLQTREVAHCCNYTATLYKSITSNSIQEGLKGIIVDRSQDVALNENWQTNISDIVIEE